MWIPSISRWEVSPLWLRSLIWNLSSCINHFHLMISFLGLFFPSLCPPLRLPVVLRGWEHVTSKAKFIASVRSKEPMVKCGWGLNHRLRDPHTDPYRGLRWIVKFAQGLIYEPLPLKRTEYTLNHSFDSYSLNRTHRKIYIYFLEVALS